MGGPLGDPRPGKMRGDGNLRLAPPVEMHPPRKKQWCVCLVQPTVVWGLSEVGVLGDAGLGCL